LRPYGQSNQKNQPAIEFVTELGARQDRARVLAAMGWSVFALGIDTENEIRTMVKVA
jgi:hypothetical protein